MQGQSSLLETVVVSNNVSEVIDSQEYFDSLRHQVETEIENVEKIKQDLYAQKNTKDQQLSELSSLKTAQLDQKSYLENRQNLKNRLLSNTKGAIEDLAEEQEQDKASLASLKAKIDRIISMSRTGGQIVSANDGSWYYSQLDPRWSDIKMGRYATIGNYGCLLTSLTMIAKYYGSNYTPATATNASAFNRSGGSQDGALISTSIVHDGKSQPINWSTLDGELAAGRPVVAGVALGIDMGNSYGVSHFIVIKSKIGENRYAMHDPLGDGRGYNMSQVKAMRIIRP